MIQDKPKKFFALFLLIIFMSIFYFTQKSSTDIEAIKSVDRTDLLLIENDRSDDGDAPFIVQAKIISEKANELIFDVKYFMPDTAEGDYSISIHPDMNGWSYSANTLHSGMNNKKITVTFRPKTFGQVKAESKLMHIYINHNEDNQYIGKVFDRSVEFPKIWMQ